MVLERPTLKATLLSDNSILLDWNPIEGAVKYRICETVSPDGVPNGITSMTESIRGPFKDYREYAYWVIAIAADGTESLPSWKQMFNYKASDSGPVTGENPTPPVEPVEGWPNALWVGDYPNDVNGVQNSGKWGNTQYQKIDGNIQNGVKPMPLTTHPILGRCLKPSLLSGELRHEVQPAGTYDSDWDSGETWWFGWNEVLAQDFPINSSENFAVISQVHQSSSSGSPPLEFNARSGALYIRGSSTGYNRKVCNLEVNKRYNIVCGLKLVSGTGTSTINVYVNGEHLIQDYKPGVSFGNDCYWKGCSSYASKRAPRPFTHYQNGHRIGRSYADVA